MRALIALAAALAVAAPLGAQGNTPITAAKRAATGAATKANARNAATSGVAGATPQAATTKPAASQSSTPKPAATKKAKPAASRAAATRGTAPVQAGAAEPPKPGASTTVAQRGAAGEVNFYREVYTYPGAGRRDPMMSLLQSGDLRPLLTDLKLVTVLYDPTGRNSVAILRDVSTKDQYRVKLGQQLGRMRVVQIQPKHLVLTIEEFGYSRQETLALNDTTSARTQ